LAGSFLSNIHRYSPSAGAGITLFYPPNSWSTYVPRGSWEFTDGFPSILRAELVITTFNAVTDILRKVSESTAVQCSANVFSVLVLVYSIFQHLNLASGRTQFRAASLLCTLFSISLMVALIRLVVLCTVMHGMYARLAFDTLTDFEAFIAGCAASIPAVRVLMRDYNSQDQNTAVDQTPPSTPTSATFASMKKPIVGFPEKWALFSFGSRRCKEESTWEETYVSVRKTSVSGQGWAKRMEEAKNGDSARAEALAPVGTVEVTVTGGKGNSCGIEPWREFVAKNER
jgi:hypothetical protein